MIPISVVIVTKNEEKRLEGCLKALSAFDDVWVVDSQSRDSTCSIAAKYDARIEHFVWNGRYPKKRGWCLDYLDLAHDWVFFVDADEIVTPELVEEIKILDFQACAGFFIKARYEWKGRLLKYGLRNNKLALFNRQKMEFPVIDDLGIVGMGEIEGHYQPVLKAGSKGGRIGQLSAAMLHRAENGWNARHLRYAMWEAGMNARQSWPVDPDQKRQALKVFFRKLPMPIRALAAFIYSYVLKLGFLDGAAGFDFARSRAVYYRMILDASKDLEQIGAASTSRSDPHKAQG